MSWLPWKEHGSVHWVQINLDETQTCRDGAHCAIDRAENDPIDRPVPPGVVVPVPVTSPLFHEPFVFGVRGR